MAYHLLYKYTGMIRLTFFVYRTLDNAFLREFRVFPRELDRASDVPLSSPVAVNHFAVDEFNYNLSLACAFVAKEAAETVCHYGNANLIKLRYFEIPPREDVVNLTRTAVETIHLIWRAELVAARARGESSIQKMTRFAVAAAAMKYMEGELRQRFNTPNQFIFPIIDFYKVSFNSYIDNNLIMETS